MRHGTFLLFLISILFTRNSEGQNVQLTFQVDMRHENISPNGVHVAGDFQAAAGFGDNWNPGSTPLEDGDGDLVYETTVEVPPGFYLYKFVNGSSWQEKPELPSTECAVSDGGGNVNRPVTVGTSGLILPPVLFDSCNATVRLSVNMGGINISEDGVYIAGDFQEEAGLPSDWIYDATPMRDVNRDGTYEISIDLAPGEYHFRFVNGNKELTAENFSGDCTEDTGQGFEAREITVGEGATEYPTYCFNTCDECDPAISTDYDTEWWNETVFYEIFVRSFYDSDGDGIGDFRGITNKLDYLNDGDPSTTEDLGITGIWLMPTMPSPSYHGYDVTDYFDIESDYGTMEDFEEFLDAAHDRGIKVIIDFVMNHSSSQHSWFTKSANGDPEYRDWYIWRDTDPGFNGPWGQQVWHNRNGDYYYGLFWGGMPDLNYDNPKVQEEIFRSAEFWLDSGVDGFRLDAIKYLDENGNVLENTGKTFEILEEFNDLYKSNNADAVTVGEVWSNTESILPYIQEGRLDLCFEFDLAYSILDAVNFNEPWRIFDQLDVVQTNYPKLQYATFLTNHDIDRVLSTLGGSVAKMKQAASLYLTMPGVPFIYYGEEVGMRGTGAHENIRRPMQWTSGQYAGFSSSAPWYGVGSNYQTNNVAMMDTNANSLLSHYRDLVQLRTYGNGSPALTKGYLLPGQSSDEEILAYARIYDNEAFVVVSNFSSIPKEVTLNFPVTSLEPNQYGVYDALQNNTYGTINIQENGAIINWDPLDAPLNPRETRVIGLDQTVTSTFGPAIQGPEWVQLYPNPAKDFVTIQIESNIQPNGVISFYRADGAFVQGTAVTSFNTNINIDGISPGLYFARIETSAGVTVKPLVIAR